jgi:hypothetical protein
MSAKFQHHEDVGPFEKDMARQASDEVIAVCKARVAYRRALERLDRTGYAGKALGEQIDAYLNQEADAFHDSGLRQFIEYLWGNADYLAETGRMQRTDLRWLAADVYGQTPQEYEPGMSWSSRAMEAAE